MNKFLQAYRRNLQTWSEVNRLAADCGEALMRFHGQAMQQSLDGCARALESLSDNAPAADKVKKSADLAREAWQNSALTARELTSILTRSQRDMYHTVSQRLQESVSEMQDVLPPQSRRKA